MACATPPPNDTCMGAIPVGVPSVTTGTTALAANNYTPLAAGTIPGCAGGGGNDVVYSFTVGAMTPMTISLVGAGGWDTVVYVRRGVCEATPEVACNDDSAGLSSQVALVATPGTYYVFVDGFGAGSTGAFTLTISLGGPREQCTNGRDDDGDGQVDCADADCAADPGCMICRPSPENTVATCGDGRDNNCNGLIDCADPSCASVPACCMVTGPENTALRCRNGRDDDCNGLIDCADPGCRSMPFCCVTTGPENTAAVCSDARDNDCDGLIDCADADCAATAACCRPAPELCTDGRDNDCDGLIDCIDPNCAGSPACSPTCVPTAMSERGTAACTNGLDDDCDGESDCADSDCSPFGAVGECCDGRDNNGNGIVDEFACRCAVSPECAGVGAGGRFPSTACYSATLSVCGPPCNTIGGNAFCSMLLAGTTCDTTSGQCR
jgi:hypothetical protein